MVLKEQVLEIIENALADTEVFLVELKVSADSKIKVLIDGMQGVNIRDCVRVSRAIEGELDREVVDFALEVSSPGLTNPLKVFKQYQKNQGKKLSVTLSDGEKLEGVLKVAEIDFLILEVERLELQEGKKKKQIVVEEQRIDFSDIKSAIVVISF